MGAIYAKWWLEHIFRHYKDGQKESGFWRLVSDILDFEDHLIDLVWLVEDAIALFK